MSDCFPFARLSGCLRRFALGRYPKAWRLSRSFRCLGRRDCRRGDFQTHPLDHEGQGDELRPRPLRELGGCGSAGHGEVAEEPRGQSLRLAVGELLICPYCLGQWVGGSITVGYVAAPRLTRLLTSLYTSLALADFAQIAYKAGVEAA